MAKAEWGSKHICAECGIKYYDLGRKPASCPKCGTVAAPEPAPKPRRAAPPAPAPAEPPKRAAVEENLEPDLVEAPDIGDDEDEEGDDLIEDASELGEDEDDMAEVIESSADDKEDR